MRRREFITLLGGAGPRHRLRSLGARAAASDAGGRVSRQRFLTCTPTVCARSARA